MEPKITLDKATSMHAVVGYRADGTVMCYTQTIASALGLRAVYIRQMVTPFRVFHAEHGKLSVIHKKDIIWRG